MYVCQRSPDRATAVSVGKNYSSSRNLGSELSMENVLQYLSETQWAPENKRLSMTTTQTKLTTQPGLLATGVNECSPKIVLNSKHRSSAGLGLRAIIELIPYDMNRN